MTVRQGAYVWHGYRGKCKNCSSLECVVRQYTKRIQQITHIEPWVAPSELALEQYKERISSIGEIPPYYTKNERSRADWASRRDHHIARKRAYNSRPDVRERQCEWEKSYRKTARGRSVRDDCQARRRARIRKNGEEHLSWFYRAVRELPLVQCHLCGVWITGEECHVDHVVPIAAGGGHTRNNLATACPECNLKKQSNPDWTPAAVMVERG